MAKYILLFIAITFLFFGGRKYIYSATQHLGYKVGINFNNIATKNYEDFIRSQSDDLESEQIALFLNKTVSFRDISQIPTSVLGASSSMEEKSIDVNLSEQRLYMKEGDKNVGSFLISSGKWSPTPTGQWPIWIKLRYTRMKGGSKALGTYYDLPNVPYTMYYDRGYGIHGAYWHSNFGHPMSHGCINMKPEEAGIVFNWAEVGTKVRVHY